MQMRFLCPTHREWLATHFSAALNHYNLCLDTSYALTADGDLRGAVAYSGCAFDIAFILLDDATLSAVKRIQMLTGSALNLNENIQKLEHSDREMLHVRSALTIVSQVCADGTFSQQEQRDLIACRDALIATLPTENNQPLVMQALFTGDRDDIYQPASVH